MEATKPTPALKPHRPWTTNLSWIFYSLVVMVAAWFFLYQKGKTEEFIAVAVLGAVIVVTNFHSLNARIHGQLVEKKAIRQLEKIDKTKVIKNKPLPGRGDIDVIFKGKTETYNVEIKSVQEARKVTKKHIKQALDASDYLHTLPVIWLPKAPERKIVNKDGVTIFGGTAKQLFSYLN
jgi:Holliday junction resolvase-like predicted endonuclease